MPPRPPGTECVLCPCRTERGCLARRVPQTAAPLCGPWLAAAVLGLGGCGRRHSSSPGGFRGRAPWRPHPSVWEPGLHPVLPPPPPLGGQGHGPQGPQNRTEPRPAPSACLRAQPAPQLRLALFKAFRSCWGCIPCMGPRSFPALGWARQTAGWAGAGARSCPCSPLPRLPLQDTHLAPATVTLHPRLATSSLRRCRNGLRGRLFSKRGRRERETQSRKVSGFLDALWGQGGSRGGARSREQASR